MRKLEIEQRAKEQIVTYLKNHITEDWTYDPQFKGYIHYAVMRDKKMTFRLKYCAGDYGSDSFFLGVDIGTETFYVDLSKEVLKEFYQSIDERYMLKAKNNLQSFLNEMEEEINQDKMDEAFQEAASRKPRKNSSKKKKGGKEQ